MNVVKRPIDPYSPEWLTYWSANPHLARGVGADAAADAGADTGANGADASAVAAAAAKASGADNGSNGADVKADVKADATKPAADATNQDWTADLPDDLKETGKRFASKADAVRSIIDLRKRESQVRVPGKDAKPEEIAAYHKAIGVPDKPEAYEFFDAEGFEVTDEVKAERAEWGKRFQALGISKDAAKKLSQFVTEDQQRSYDNLIASDKKFAEEQEAALRAEWKGEEYERNKTLANNAFREVANRTGLNLEALTKIETKDGRLLMDRADMVRMFAAIGREMAEGTLGPTLTDTEKDTVDDQIRGVRDQITEAQASGDSKRANKLYQQEQALIAKRSGNKTIVGGRGRMV